MHVFELTRSRVLAALETLKQQGFLPGDVAVSAVTTEPPKDASHGEVATNAAMVVSKAAGKNPREVAEKLKALLENDEGVAEINVAGPGFINFRFTPEFWRALVPQILSDENSYGNSSIGNGTKVNLEYVSANPTGPMHIGHARGAVVGDALARLLQKAGYDVTKEYYINDAGSQVDVLARSAYLRYREALGETINIPEGFYPGEYLKVVGESFAAQNGRDYLGVPETEWLPVIKEFALEAMLILIKSDLAALGVEHDVFISEASLHKADKVEEVLADFQKKGLLYTGTLEPPKGKLPEDWEEREQLLFKATQFGDDTDRPLKKSNGTATYFAADIAYHKDKVDRKFNRLILVLGADHGGYVKRLKAAVNALSHGTVQTDVILMQLVNLMANGEQMKMSKRAGTFVTLRDMVDAVGKDAIRFGMLTRKADAVIDFDVEKVKEQSRENPVFYVQYAHARIHSVLRQAAEKGLLPEAEPQLQLLEAAEELQLIKRMAEWPRIVEQAAISAEPHRITYYLHDLASDFHALWNSGKEEANMRFIIEDAQALTIARLALIKACSITIRSGLGVLGVEPVQEL